MSGVHALQGRIYEDEAKRIEKAEETVGWFFFFLVLVSFWWFVVMLGHCVNLHTEVIT